MQTIAHERVGSHPRCGSARSASAQSHRTRARCRQTLPTGRALDPNHPSPTPPAARRYRPVQTSRRAATGLVSGTISATGSSVLRDGIPVNRKWNNPIAAPRDIRIGNAATDVHFGRGSDSGSRWASNPARESRTPSTSAFATLRTSCCTAVSLSSASWLIAYGS